MSRRDNDTIQVSICYKEPELFEGLGNDFDCSEYTQRDNCLILTMWDGNEVIIPMCEIAYFEARY